MDGEWVENPLHQLGRKSTPACPTSRSPFSAPRRPRAPVTPSSNWPCGEGLRHAGVCRRRRLRRGLDRGKLLGHASGRPPSWKPARTTTPLIVQRLQAEASGRAGHLRLLVLFENTDTLGRASFDIGAQRGSQQRHDRFLEYPDRTSLYFYVRTRTARSSPGPRRVHRRSTRRTTPWPTVATCRSVACRSGR